MPLEIRNKIWAAVLGDRLIHLMCAVKSPSIRQPEEKQTWRHVVCKHDCRENENIEVYTSIDEENGEEHVFNQSHHHCDGEMADQFGAMPYTFGAKHEPNYESMHLTVLRVCRQIYNEANSTLWSTNVFSFDHANVTFTRFIDARTTHQKRSLRGLRFQMDWVDEGDKPWNRVLGVTLIRSLTGLRKLRLQINHSMEGAFYQKAKARGNQLGLFQMRQVGLVDKLAILPLTDVEVFVGDDSPPQRVNGLWTAEDRIEYAEEIRQILLNPRGAEKYAQEQKEFRESNREDREREKEREKERRASGLAAAIATLSALNYPIPDLEGI